MLDVLQREGGATATDCAAVVGLTASSCSWHLRQLTTVGLVRDADTADVSTGEDGRERRWVAATPAWQVNSDEVEAEPQDAEALDVAATRALMQASDATVQAFTVAAVRGQEDDGKDASRVSNSALHLTAEELAAVTEAVMHLVRSYTVRRRPDPPAGAPPVHAALRFVSSGLRS